MVIVCTFCFGIEEGLCQVVYNFTWEYICTEYFFFFFIAYSAFGENTVGIEWYIVNRKYVRRSERLLL